jgi:hypothetical protein
MTIPDPLIFQKPLHIWLGMLTFLCILAQIMIGLQILKVSFWVHTKILWKIILTLGLVHAIYGVSIYF